MLKECCVFVDQLSISISVTRSLVTTDEKVSMYVPQKVQIHSNNSSHISFGGGKDLLEVIRRSQSIVPAYDG